MEAATIPWRPIGELFVEKGLISQEQLEEALAEQAATGLRLGEILVKRQLISSPDLTQALMEQLGREVAKEEGFGTGLWAEIRRRNAAPGADTEPEPIEADRSAFGEGLTRKLGVVSDEASEVSDPQVSWVIDEVELGQLHGLPHPDEQTDEDRVEADVLRESLSEAHVEVELLRQDVAERAQRLEALEAEISTLKAEAEAAEVRDETGSARVDALEYELAAVQARAEQLETTVLDRDGRITELQTALDELASRPPDPNVEAQGKALERELAGVRGQVAELETALTAEQEAHSDARKRLDDATSAEENARQALLEIERGFDAARAERDAARSEASAALSERESELATLRDQVAAAEAALGAEREAHADTRSHAEQTAADSAQARQVLDGFEQERRELAERARTLEEDLASRQADKSQLEERLHAAEHRAAELDGQIAGFAEQLAVLHRERDDFAERASMLEESLAARRTTETSLGEQLEAAESRSAELGSEMVSLADRLAAAESSLEGAESAREAARRYADDAGARLSEAEERIAELSATVDRLEGEKAELSTAAADQRLAVERELQAAESRAAELGVQITGLAEQLAVADSALEDTANARDDARRDADAAATRLSEADEETSNLATAVERLEGEKTELSRTFSDQLSVLEHELGALGARLAEESASHSETRCVLSQALTELAAREPVHVLAGQSEPGPQDYLCFTPTKDGYRLVVRTGILPAAGDECAVDGVAHVVTRVARSPLPFDSRTCVYLMAAA